MMFGIHEMLIFEICLFVLLGVGSGLLSGLLGAGGGLVIVPGLLLVFRLLHMPSALLMHMAVGTSLATMIIIAIRSLISHMRHKVSFFDVYKKIAPGVMVGVVCGGILAHFVHSRWLSIAFGVFVFYMAYRLLFVKNSGEQNNLPSQAGMLIVGTFVGLLSGLLGVAGSAFSVPYLTGRGVKMHTAVVVSVAIAMTVSVLGTITFVLTGLHAVGLPKWSTGYVYWPAWLGIIIGGLFSAPWGAKLSHRFSDKKLKQFFAGFLIIVGLHMLIPL